MNEKRKNVHVVGVIRFSIINYLISNDFFVEFIENVLNNEKHLNLLRVL